MSPEEPAVPVSRGGGRGRERGRGVTGKVRGGVRGGVSDEREGGLIEWLVECT